MFIQKSSFTFPDAPFRVTFSGVQNETEINKSLLQANEKKTSHGGRGTNCEKKESLLSSREKKLYPASLRKRVKVHRFFLCFLILHLVSTNSTWRALKSLFVLWLKASLILFNVASCLASQKALDLFSSPVRVGLQLHLVRVWIDYDISKI